MDVDGSTPFIDVEREDSLGIFVLLENSTIFSFSGPTISKVDGITEIAPVYSIFPEQFLVHFPRFKARIIFSCQEINLASEDHIGLSGNIGAYRSFGRYQASSQVGREDGVSNQLKTIGRRAHGRRDTAPYPVFVCRGELTGATELRGRIRNVLLLLPFCFPCSFSVL